MIIVGMGIGYGDQQKTLYHTYYLTHPPRCNSLPHRQSLAQASGGHSLND